MDDPLLVRGLERFGNLVGDGERLVDRHRPAHETVGERLALDQFHDEQMPTSGFLEAVQRGDVWMIQGGEDSGFTLEARQAIRIGGPRLRQQLDRHRTTELRVVGAIDFAHPTGAKQRVDFVRAESRTIGDWQSCGDLPALVV